MTCDHAACGRKDEAAIVVWQRLMARLGGGALVPGAPSRGAAEGGPGREIALLGQRLTHAPADVSAWRELDALIRRNIPSQSDDAQRHVTLANRSGADVAALVRQADRLRDGGFYREAAAAYAEVLTLYPERTDLRVQLGNMQKDSGAFADAEAAYRRALLERPGDADTSIQLGHALKAQGQREAALAAYRHAAMLDPEAAPAIVELASAGQAGAQLLNFEAQLRARGAETLLSLSAEVAAMRARLDAISAALPEPSGWTAFPVAQYGLFRDLLDLPSPPRADCRITVLLRPGQDGLANLYRQLAAMRAQSHPDWHLVVIGTDAAHHDAVVRAGIADPRISWQTVSPPPAATDWVLLLPEAAIPHRHALAWIAHAASLGPAEAFVCDEAVTQPDGTRHAYLTAELRGPVDADSLRSANLWGDTIAVRADQDLTTDPDALLRAAAARGKAGHIPLPLISRDTTPARPVITRPPAIYAASGDARITVIIPTRDNPDDVAVMAESLRRHARASARLTIAVLDNGGGEPTTARLADLAAAGLITLHRVDEPFNWARLNNQAVAATDAELVVFANDDMRMLTPHWDDILRVQLARPEIGAVGVRLLYEDNTIQHAGMLLGWRGGAIHDGLYEPADAPGPGHRWRVTREVGAVTGAFLATRRDVFNQIGGFDAQELPVGYSDVDYALKLRDAGLKVLWTPDITLYHHESKTRGLDHLDPARRARDTAEREVMQARWGAAMEFDPGVNPYWHDASLPFRLITQPSLARLERYIAAHASGNPWKPIR